MAADSTDPIADLQTFIEDQLQVLVPTIDLSQGSPAQTLFIQPLLAKLGTDPFDTDIQSFLLDRFQQEFPEVYAGDPSVINDTLVNPLILILEPFKREIQTIMLNQSLQDPNVLSTDDAAALGANWFDPLNPGGFSGGSARVFYANPTNVTVEITTRFFTPDGLNFFPNNPQSITAEEMVFNRSGSLYFIDIAVTAEAVGTQYNIAKSTLTGVDGLFGQVSVTNLANFSDGTSTISVPVYVSQIQQSLTERSLVTRRGATAQLNQAYQGQVSAIQVVGANDPEMQRDIIVATAPDNVWLMGQVSIYGNVAMVQASIIDDTTISPTPQPGDTLYIYLDKYSYSGRWSTLPQNQRMVRLQVQQVLAGPMQSTNQPYQVAYLIQFTDNYSFLPGLNLPTVTVLQGGISHVGTVQITSLPDLGKVTLTIANQTIHVYGHSDIYVVPPTQTTAQAIFDSLVDDPQNGKYFSIQSLYLQTSSGSNQVTDLGSSSPPVAAINFQLAGIQPGDLINILNGSDAGVYVIQKVVGTSLYLTTNLTESSIGISYQVIQDIHVNWAEPKIPKLPFDGIPSSDLDTVIGSTTFNFTAPTTNIVNYGVKVGDTIRLLSGVDQGDFTITAINSGQSITVDREAGASESNLPYEIFTAEEALSLPLIRITELSVLDSSQQTTGIDVPYGKPVAVTPTADFTTALVRGISQRNSGYVLPVWNSDSGDLFVQGSSVAAGTPTPPQTSNRQYSMGFQPVNAGDIYKPMVFDDGSQSELLFTLNALTGPGPSYFLATSEDLTQLANFPPIDPKPGDALTLTGGPNAGSYLIQNVIKFQYDLGNSIVSPQPVAWLYFIQIYGTFPVDVFHELVEFIDNNGGTDGLGTKITKINGPVTFPDFFVNTFNHFGTWLNTVLNHLGAASPGAASLQLAVMSICQVGYHWGDPARGTLRSFFIQPTLFEQNTALSENPTLYSLQLPNGNTIRYRPDPNLYQKYQVVPARVDSDTDPEQFPRDIAPNGSSSITFTSATRSSMFNVGVEAGDTLQVYEEVFMLGSTGSASLGTGSDHMIAVQSLFGSTLLTALPSTASGGEGPFNTGMTGDLLFIDEGTDAGGYRITSVVSPDVLGNSFQVTIDRPLSTTTPADIIDGSGGSTSYSSPDNLITVPGTLSTTAYINDYITIYGGDTAFQGSYQITAAVNGGGNTTFTVMRGSASGNFVARSGYYWEITQAPASAPTASTLGTGTVLYGLTPIRLYDEVSQNFPITAVSTNISASQVTVGTSTNGQTSPELGISQPFVIYRPNVRRVTPTEMSENQQSYLYYFDTVVVSLGPEPTFNIPANQSYLTAVQGTYDCIGYLMLVDDYTLSYSMNETGAIQFPTRILPVGSADSQDNFLVLFGIPMLVNYVTAPIVQQIQNYCNSADDRVVAANILVRHFLPTYASYDATYSGGEPPGTIGDDIINYFNTLPIETAAEVSKVEAIIDTDGGDPVVPTTIYISLNDWDRNIWVEFSETQIGGTTTNVPYHGTPRVSFLIPGPNVSGQSPLPIGERINLTQT